MNSHVINQNKVSAFKRALVDTGGDLLCDGNISRLIKLYESYYIKDFDDYPYDEKDCEDPSPWWKYGKSSF